MRLCPAPAHEGLVGDDGQHSVLLEENNGLLLDKQLKNHSFIFSKSFILVRVGDPESIPGILGVNVGIHPGWVTSPLEGTTHTLGSLMRTEDIYISSIWQTGLYLILFYTTDG